MKLLFFGDIYGKSGRLAVTDYLKNSNVKESMIIINAENAANGSGITKEIVTELFEAGAHVITTGNHAWGQKNSEQIYDMVPHVLRPLNYPDKTPGKGYTLYKHGGKRILVINIMGQLFMSPTLESPFECISKFLQNYRLGDNVDAIFVDFHAEATSEKYGLAHFLDGKITAIIGTHTHVPTNDAQILEYGTAFMSDVGMNGDYNSIIGLDKKFGVARFIKKHKFTEPKFAAASGQGTTCAVEIVVNEYGLASKITPIVKGPIIANR